MKFCPCFVCFQFVIFGIKRYCAQPIHRFNIHVFVCFDQFYTCVDFKMFQITTTTAVMLTVVPLPHVFALELTVQHYYATFKNKFSCSKLVRRSASFPEVS